MDIVYDDKYWLIPPIIGEIYEKYVVILYEQVEKSPMLCQISEYNTKNLVQKDWIYPENNHLPTRNVLKIPEYGTYDIEWLYNDDLMYKTTIKISNDPDKMIFVSCDLPEADTKTNDSMWTKMMNEINNDDQICLFHNGDQAYMDKVFNDSITLLKNEGNNDNNRKKIIQKYGQRYYNTWKPHNYILSHVSNYNLWDDHEIKNNVVLYDDNISSNAKIVRSIAVKAYSIYQESLHLYKNSIISDYSWYKIMGKSSEILILSIERTSKYIDPISVINAVNMLSETNKIKKLILCFSSAPIPPPNGNYGYMYRKLTGDKGTVETSKFWEEHDLAILYKGLFDWIDYYKGEVLVVGGDLHFGTHGVVRCNSKEINVVISSPITNQPTTDRWLASKGMQGRHVILDEIGYYIIFTTVSSKARRCYATVDIKTSPINVHMHYSDKKLPKHALKYINTLMSFT